MRALAMIVILVAACEPHAPSAPNPGAGSSAPRPGYCAGQKILPAYKTCLTDPDCNGGSRCYPEGVPTYEGVCGDLVGPTRRCETDPDCKSGKVCVDTGPGACMGRNTACKPRCTASSCAAGERCQPDGHCVPIACTAGYACPAHMQCLAAKGADAHGCTTINCWEPGGACEGPLECVKDLGCQVKKCSSSSECSCGTCVAGQCMPGPGECGPLETPGPPG